MNYLLSEAEEPIRQALERLVEKDEGLHPFVIVDKVGRPDVFVQFAGSRSRALVFDVPLMRISAETTTPEAGAARAVAVLAASLGVLQDERVGIHEEEDTSGRWKGVPLWRLLA